MNILRNNPYRLLGVYSNSPTKERLANHNRMKAFLKVGKPVSFPLDLPQYLSAIQRTEASVMDAEAQLTLPKDQLLYAQFWFVKATHLDEVAFNHLFAGEIDKAEEIWQKKDTASSLQNRIVCALMREDYRRAVTCAEILYGNPLYSNQFVSAILGTDGNADIGSLAFRFLDVLCDEVGANKLLPFITDDAWESHAEEKAVKPLVDNIQDAIAIAKKSKGKGAEARLKAGEALRKNTKSAFQQLKGFLSATDLQYQMIADKLGLEILQCGIDYFNGSEEPEAAHKAMSLQKYAQSIVVGQMAKDRCKENVDILQKIIDNLPPLEVYAEDKAIKEELRKYCQLPDKICHAVTLLDNTKPHIQSIKSKLGASNSYYLKISTQIVGNALINIIAEVNEAQTKSIADLEITLIKTVLEKAWGATIKMDGFDMESDFKSGKYNTNRSILKELCQNLGVPMPGECFKYVISSGNLERKVRPTPKPQPAPKPQSAPTPQPAPTPRPSSGGTSDNRQHSTSSSNSSRSGWIVVLFLSLIVFGGLGLILGAIIGGCIDGENGEIIGSILGFILLNIIFGKLLD